MAEETPFSGKLIHVGVVVRDIDKAVKRLESLGIEPFKPLDSSSLPQITEEIPYQGKSLVQDWKTYMSNLGDIELGIFEPGKAESPWKDFLETKGEGIQHLAFAVDDLDKEIARFTEHGASKMSGIRWQGDGGAVYMDVGVSDIVIELYKE